MMRYSEFVDRKSNKFWEISASGKKVSVRFGKRGSKGQTRRKEFPTQMQGKIEADKLMTKKIKEGYVENAIATRYDKLAINFLAAVQLVPAIILLN
jgi:predicted DNA-binding WGR domain protein